MSWFLMALVEMFERFVKPQKNCDVEAGIDLLVQFESLPVDETRDYGFSLSEAATVLQIMVDHQKRLKQAQELVKTWDLSSQS